jgi:cell division protein FtsL
MAIAARAVPKAATTEYRQQVPARVHRKHKKKRNSKVMRWAVYSVVLLGLIGYVGIYAQVTRCGFTSADLSRQIRQTKMENQGIKADIQVLSSPDRLAAAATAAKMIPSKDSLFIGTHETTRVAKANP